MIDKDNAEKIAFFLDICKDRKLAPKTLESYDYALSTFYNYLSSHELPVEKASLFDIRNFKKESLAGFAPSSQNLKLSAIRKFYETLQEFNVLSFNPVSKSFSNRLERKTLTFVPEDVFMEIEKYFEENSSDNYLLGLRLMYFSGLRVGEIGLVDLINDISYVDGKMFLKIHGKGAKQRIVPVFSKAAAKQINNFRSKHSSLLPLHIGTFMQTYDYHLERFSKKSNTPKYSCHDFRRGFAVNLYAKTHDIEMLRVLLGHESYNTSLMYIRDATINVYQLSDTLFAWSRRRARTVCLGTWCQDRRRRERSEFSLYTR